MVECREEAECSSERVGGQLQVNPVELAWPRTDLRASGLSFVLCQVDPCFPHGPQHAGVGVPFN